MANSVSSVHDGNRLTVSEIIGQPTWIAERVIDNLDGAMITDALYRDAGESSLAVSYREAAAPYLDEDAEDVAEFAEIPVANLSLGEVNTLVAKKVAVGVRISYEMRKFNQLGMVERQIDALQGTMVRSDVRNALAALGAASVAATPASAPWSDSGSDPVGDIFDAIEAVQAAHVDGDENANFGYNPDTLILHPAALTALTRNETVQRLYTGSAALENPLYKGQLPQTLFGLNVLPSRWADPTRVIVAEAGAVGFRADAMPLEMTALYPEGGTEQHGGPNMSYRADAWRARIVGVDGPKAAHIVTGVRA